MRLPKEGSLVGGPCEYSRPKDLRSNDACYLVSSVLIINPRPVGNVREVLVVLWKTKGRSVYEIGLDISGGGWHSTSKLCQDNTVAGEGKPICRFFVGNLKRSPGFKREGSARLENWFYGSYSCKILETQN